MSVISGGSLRDARGALYSVRAFDWGPRAHIADVVIGLTRVPESFPVSSVCNRAHVRLRALKARLRGVFCPVPN